MEKLESAVKIACMSAYKRKYGNMYMVKNEQGANAGAPDITICHKGFFVAIELKRSEKRKPTLLQLARLSNIQKSGGICGVAYDVESFMRIVEKAEDKYNRVKKLLTD